MSLSIQIWADTADVEQIWSLHRSGNAQGFTTNPTLLRRAGVTDYREWAMRALDAADGALLSLEVLADELDEMEAQARELASWGPTVLVKIPVTNTEGTPTYALVARLLADGIKINHTAILSAGQVAHALTMIPRDAGLYVSIFAGRIADTGQHAPSVVRECRNVSCHHPGLKFIWASTREIYNACDAQAAGCHAITMPPEMILKMNDLVGRGLSRYSRETVQQFRRDALESGIRL